GFDPCGRIEPSRAMPAAGRYIDQCVRIKLVIQSERPARIFICATADRRTGGGYTLQRAAIPSVTQASREVESRCHAIGALSVKRRTGLMGPILGQIWCAEGKRAGSLEIRLVIIKEEDTGYPVIGAVDGTSL